MTTQRSVARKYDPRLAARSLARKLALQALYRWQINDSPWQDVIGEFETDTDMPKADREYFGILIAGVCAGSEALDAAISIFAERTAAGLDPIERAVLLLSVFELRHRPDVPYKVVINEAVNLARRFGATDGHKFVNAVLDRAARELRSAEL